MINTKVQRQLYKLMMQILQLNYTKIKSVI